MMDTKRTGSAIGRGLSNAPWWMVSAGIHAVILMGAAIVYMEKAWSVDTGPIIVGISERRPVDPTVPETAQNGLVSQPTLNSDDREKPAIDPVIFNPLARPSDHNESKKDKNDHTMDGFRELLGYLPDAKGFLGRAPGQTGGTHESLGVGFGRGFSGRHGVPGGGGHEDLVNKYHGDGRTENAVTAALRWLARHQNADGGWSAAGFDHACQGGRCSGPGEADFDAGVTALSVLAFLGAGYIPQSRDIERDPVAPDRELRFGEVVKKGLQWLLSHQDPEGAVGERGPKYLYNHAIATLALSEGYAMAATPALREPAQRAIDFLVAAQNPGKGWRYESRGGDNDTSVTGWAVMAFKSAELAGLAFPPATYGGALAWISEASERDGYYRVGYNARGTGKVYVPGVNESWSDHPSMSAVAILSRIFIQKKRDPALGSVNLLLADLPAWTKGQVDFYYWYYGSLAVFQYDSAQGAFWNRWNEGMKNALVPHQSTRAAGCENGSWDPAEDRWGREGGRVYAAAINCLTLEVYYRYAHVFGAGAK